MNQKIKDKKWIDESGTEVPVEYITPGLRMKERNASSLLKSAKDLNKRLTVFKKIVIKLSDDVYQKAMEEFKTKANGKGNFTWFNFDRSIKIEVSISERTEFDDLAIEASKSKLDEFLTNNIDSKAEFVKDLVIDAFSTSKGKIDADKVFQLMKYRTKIKHPLFQEAINILSDGIRRPGSKTYFRIWQKKDNGSYALVNLNFSNI